MSKIRGVNFGEWLVLEKWMDVSVFEGVEADDEDTLCRLLPQDEKIKRFKKHRDTFITEADVHKVKKCGLNAIRLPIPHFLFGDDPHFCNPYVPCIEYVDKCFEWAERAGLQILLDVHTAPDCQNGYDNGGICAVSNWHTKPENITRVVDVLAMLAERYGKRGGLLGIELLNEPASDFVWERNQRFYNAYDKERAKGSGAVPLSVVLDFYVRGYEAIRKYMNEDKMVVFHDAFRFDAFKYFFKEQNFKNAALDTHIYLEMEETNRFTSDLSCLHKILVEEEEKILKMQEIVPVIVGEWSLPHSTQPSMDNSKRYYSYRMMADAMLQTFESALAHFYWSYKIKFKEKAGWDFCVNQDREWLPSRFDFEQDI